MSRNTGASAAAAGCVVLVALAVWGAWITVIVHFIRKLW